MKHAIFSAGIGMVAMCILTIAGSAFAIRAVDTPPDRSSHSCTPINYMPILCSDGSAPQPVQDSRGCITGYQCVVSQPTTTPTTTPVSFFVATPQSGTVPLTVSFFSIVASFNQSPNKTFVISYGDSTPDGPATSCGQNAFGCALTGTTTHVYTSAGTFVARLVQRTTVTSSNNTCTTRSSCRFGTVSQNTSIKTDTVIASTTIVVQKANPGPIACTLQYAPVCGKPMPPACTLSVPACMIATIAEQTYSNMCFLNASGATFLHNGECNSNNPTPPATTTQPTSTCTTVHDRTVRGGVATVCN